MDAPSNLELDEHGNIITKPVTGWTTAVLVGSAVLLAIQYANTPEELESGQSHQIQLVLQPQLCLELAENMTKQAKRILESHSGPLM